MRPVGRAGGLVAGLRIALGHMAGARSIPILAEPAWLCNAAREWLVVVDERRCLDDTGLGSHDSRRPARMAGASLVLHGGSF